MHRSYVLKAQFMLICAVQEIVPTNKMGSRVQRCIDRAFLPLVSWTFRGIVSLYNLYCIILPLFAGQMPVSFDILYIPLNLNDKNVILRQFNFLKVANIFVHQN